MSYIKENVYKILLLFSYCYIFNATMADNENAKSILAMINTDRKTMASSIWALYDKVKIWHKITENTEYRKSREWFRKQFALSRIETSEIYNWTFTKLAQCLPHEFDEDMNYE